VRRNSKVELLGRVPLFAKCSKRDLEAIAKLADEIDLPAGKELTKQGDRGREFFVLLDGNAEVRRNNRKINALSAGDFFGEISLVSERERTATVTATDPVRALVLTKQAFGGLLRQSPEIQLKVLEAAFERLAADV
jgi:CRP/FNR family transcriptional regulator, cyclic AMP receptor protein